MIAIVKCVRKVSTETIGIDKPRIVSEFQMQNAAWVEEGIGKVLKIVCNAEIGECYKLTLIEHKIDGKELATL